MFPLMLISLADGESNTDENLSNKWLSLEALRKETYLQLVNKRLHNNFLKKFMFKIDKSLFS